MPLSRPGRSRFKATHAPGQIPAVVAASLIVLMQILHPSRPFFLQGPDNTVAVFFCFVAFAAMMM